MMGTRASEGVGPMMVSCSALKASPGDLGALAVPWSKGRVGCRGRGRGRGRGKG